MENLRQLMGAYFHQDWFVEYEGSWKAAVEDFVRREPDRVRQTIDEIDALLAANHSEAELEQVLEGLGNYRTPGDGSHAYLEWMKAIRGNLVAHTSPRA